MKQLINYSHKLGILFIIVISIFFTSCQNEDDLGLEPQIKLINQPKYIIKKINKQKINENLAVARTLNEITKTKSDSQLSPHGRLVAYENFNVVINDNYAKYLEQTDELYHSYTFKAVDLDHPDEKKNLILSLKDDGSYKEILINYYLTDQDLQTYQTTGIIDFDTKMTSTMIDENTFIVDIYSKVLGVPSTDNPNCVQFIFDGTSCNGNGHNWEQALDGGCQIYNGTVPGIPPTRGDLVGIVIDGNCFNSGGLPYDSTPPDGEDGEDGTPPSEDESSGGTGSTDSNDDSDYDPTDLDIHGNTVLAPILDDDCTFPDSEMIDQLTAILGEGNFDFDCELVDSETKNLDSIDELEPFLESIIENTFETNSSELEDVLSDIRRDVHKIEYCSFPKADIVASIKVKVPDDNNDLECLEILSVRTNLEGNNTWFDWMQFDSEDPLDTNGPIVEVDEAYDKIEIFIQGQIQIGLNIEGYPFKIRRLITIRIVYEYSAGVLIPNYSYLYFTD